MYLYKLGNYHMVCKKKKHTRSITSNTTIAITIITFSATSTSNTTSAAIAMPSTY